MVANPNKDTANLWYEIQQRFFDVKQKILALSQIIDLDTKEARVKELESLMLDANFWNDQKQVKLVQQEKNQLSKEIISFTECQKQLTDLSELLELIKDDESMWYDLESNLSNLEILVRNIEMSRMLSLPHDINNAILTINVGQGGVDSQDFSQMLLRMYKRYAERKGFNVELLDYQPGEEAGIKSATLFIAGEYAYGFLKAEIGVHRLVRISPFDSNARRHTSFASVWVIPEVDEDIEVEIKTEDLRIDTYRASGAGGQHVNKTDSAVRITHLPTNTVVACQSERSQIKNRSTAMKLLKARLYELEERKRLKEKNKAEAAKLEASFGSQIRNYVLAPYRIVKDLRTGYEMGNVDAVLDGEIQGFIENFLLKETIITPTG
jgi:peptide chain release factor 2